MRLVVTGASSFVGAWFCQTAARRGHEVIGLALETPLRLSGVTTLRLDLGGAEAASQLAAQRPDVVVHLACKVMGSGPAGGPESAATRLNRRMMDAVLAVGAPILYGSSTCVHWPKDTAYAQGRREDEARLAASGLPWAALRPSAPYGPALPGHQPRHPESFHTLARWVRRGVVPVPGDGRALRQPIHVEDLALAGLALIEGGLPGEALDAGGPEALPFNSIIDRLAAAMGRGPARKVHLPLGLLVRVARRLPGFEPALLAAASCDDPADPTALIQRSGVTPRRFEDGARSLVG
ncbi:NAD(P)-dependent oxidoreductase [Myxococcota bacterium]|nr:NAD(P)-dependent oxidoreductase [Myxococcota bacterium]